MLHARRTQPTSAGGGRRGAAGRVLSLVALLAVSSVVPMSFGVTAAGASTTTTASARAFHVSPTGSDEANGLSPATAWRSLERANRQVFVPGDQLLLQGGATFPGWLYLDPADAGEAAAPVVVGSYGTGRATVRAAGTPGIYVYNTAGVAVRDLIFIGDAGSYAGKGGISLYNDLPGDLKLSGVTVSGVDVSGFRHGVELGGARGASGFRDVVVSDARLHGNRDAGLISYGPDFRASSPTYAHANVRVTRVHAFRNPGDPTNMVRNTGNGIVLGSVTGGVIERSTAYENGASCRAIEGPAGIWTYDSHQVRIENNVSYRNRTGGPADGDGFDLDQNVSSSVLQYNLSYENDGAGYLLWTAQPNAAHRDNVVRFNISSNDARKIGWYGGITVSGTISGMQIYGNTVSMSGGVSRPPALRLDVGLSGVSVRNNVLLVEGAGPVVASPALPPTAVSFHGNDYFDRSGSFRIEWGKIYGSLDAWRTATGAETMAGAPTGHQVDPQLSDPRPPTAVTTAEAGRATGFTLAAGSPLRGRGVDLTRGGREDIGAVDHFATALTGTAAAFDVGAHQPTQAAPRTGYARTTRGIGNRGALNSVFKRSYSRR